jgi:hypothetical protein
MKRQTPHQKRLAELAEIDRALAAAYHREPRCWDVKSLFSDCGTGTYDRTDVRFNESSLNTIGTEQQGHNRRKKTSKNNCT